MNPMSLYLILAPSRTVPNTAIKIQGGLWRTFFTSSDQVGRDEGGLA
jgi:hypothetical protein